MSLRLIHYTFIAVLCIFTMQTTIARAELNIAVVDIDGILSQSKAAKSIQSQVEKKRNGFLETVKKEEEKLRAEQKSIESQSADLTKDDIEKKEALIKKAQEFEKRRLDARSSLQKRKAELDGAYSEAMNILTKTIFDVCQELATEKSIDLVITRQNIIVGNLSLDITKDVLVLLDKKLPNLTLKIK